MSAGLIIRQNINDKKNRIFWTVITVALIIFCLIVLETVAYAWASSVEQRRDDRIAVWNKTTYALTLPKDYTDEILSVEGIKTSTFATFYEGYAPDLPQNLQGFSILAVDSGSYFDVYPEAELSDETREKWAKDSNSAVISEKLSRSLGYKAGDEVTLVGRNFPGELRFKIAGTYKSDVKTFADNLFLFHWDYLNSTLDSLDLRRDQVSWIMALVDYERSMDIAKQVDVKFDTYEVQTQSMTERSMVGMFMANFASALDAIRFISSILLIIAIFILANTIVMGIREKAQQVGICRMLGFSRFSLVRMILIEAAVIGLIGGALGVFLAIMLIDYGVAGAVEENMGSLFPVFGVPMIAIIFGLIIPPIVSMFAAGIPAYEVAYRNVVKNLKGVE